MVMHGRREIVAQDYPASDPFKSSVMLEIKLHATRRDPETSKVHSAKLSLARPLLRTWFKVQQHLRNQIFAAVRELAIKRGEDPDMALFAIHQMLNNAHNLEEVLAERRDAMLSERKQRDRAHAKRALEHTRLRLEKEHLQGA